MEVLKARIKKESSSYAYGLNNKNKPIWLPILGFEPKGDKNIKVLAVKRIVGGSPEFFELWLPYDDVKIKKFDDGQMLLFDDNIEELIGVRA